jgi:hypothetical protein
LVVSTRGGAGDLKHVDDLGVEGPTLALSVVTQPVTEFFGEAERDPHFVIHGAIMTV